VGIDRSELYGSGAATPGSSGPQLSSAGGGYRDAQSYRIEVPRASTPTAPIGLPFVAYSVWADNAAGVWYRVNGRLIAPWTIGATIPLDVPSSQLTIEAISPAGYAIDHVGEDLVLIASSADPPPSPGLVVTSSPPQTMHRWVDDFTVSETGRYVHTGIIVPSAAERIVLELLTVAPVFNTLPANGADHLRGMVVVTLLDDDGNLLAQAGISPAQPSVQVVPIGQPAVVDNVDLIAETEHGAGAQRIQVGVTFWRQTL
jgi:hypothetical protein